MRTYLGIAFLTGTVGCAPLTSVIVSENDADHARARQNAAFFAPGARRVGGLSHRIVYDQVHRELHIYACLSQSSTATVAIVPGRNIIEPPRVRVTLSAEAERPCPETLTRDFPLYSLYEANPTAGPDPGGTVTNGGSSPAPGPGQTPLVHEIWFHGGNGDDRFENNTSIPSRATGSFGDDTLFGGTGNDSLSGSNDDDVINGNGGNDTINGNSGNDTLDGGSGDDRIYLGFGSDEAYGRGGDDLLKAVATGNEMDNNMLCGNDGSDTLEGAAFSDNRLDGNLPQGASDEDVDRLEGTAGFGGGDDYEYILSEDLVFENGDQFVEGEDTFPNSAEIPCG